MSLVGKITRRSFLIGASAIAGGVAFGGYLIEQNHTNPLEASDGQAAFNPWVKIDNQAITLIVPHGDKGQGIWSSQAALIAEEMDLAWGDFKLDFGPPAAAYWNRAMADEGVPFMASDHGLAAETMRGIMGGVFRTIGLQGTGGSTSIPDSWTKLREAGAMARETLKLAASMRSGILIAQLKTRDGTVILPNDSTIAYTDLAEEAAKLTPVQGTKLRDASQWRLIGKPMKRLDIVAKSTGTQDYSIDIDQPDMLFATVKASPCRSAYKSYDASKAKSMPGVEQVVEIHHGVAVIANNTWRAFQAANAIEIDWSPAPYPAEQEQHWQVLADSFTQERLDSQWRNDGAIEDAEGSYSEVREYRSPYVAHAPLEPLSATIKVTDNHVDVWTGHQLPGFVVQMVAGVTGHDQSQITFHNQFMGGSFGHRLELDFVVQAAEIANQVRGRAVKTTYSREEDMVRDFPRHIAMGRTQAVTKDGRVEGLDISIAAPSVMGSQSSRLGVSMPGPDAQIAAGSWNNPYKLPHYRMRAYRAPGLAPTSSWRAVGANGAGFIFDSSLDEAIHQAGADPLEERLRLIDHEPSRKVLEAVGEMSSWGGTLGAGKGRGVAFVESFGVPTAEVVEVTMSDAGIRIDKVWVALDVGRIVDPINFENIVQGGVIFGLGHAINSEITYSGGMAEQDNYHVHEAMRFHQTPEIKVKGLENQTKIRGVGEPPVPPAAPALANAIFAATGKRLREMPFHKFIDFV